MSMKMVEPASLLSVKPVAAGVSLKDILDAVREGRERHGNARAQDGIGSLREAAAGRPPTVDESRERHARFLGSNGKESGG